MVDWKGGLAFLLLLDRERTGQAPCACPGCAESAQFRVRRFRRCCPRYRGEQSARAGGRGKHLPGFGGEPSDACASGSRAEETRSILVPRWCFARRYRDAMPRGRYKSRCSALRGYLRKLSRSSRSAVRFTNREALGQCLHRGSFGAAKLPSEGPRGRTLRPATLLEFEALPPRTLKRFLCDHAGFKKTAASGGSVNCNECSRPWKGPWRASAPPKLPTPLPPYTAASLLSSSFQWPPRGTPTR